MTKDEIIIAQQARIEQLRRVVGKVSGTVDAALSPQHAVWKREIDASLVPMDNLSALRAHDENLLAPYQWRPIETAPKSKADGSYVHGIYLLGICPDPDTCNLESAICIIWWEPLMNGGKGLWYGEGGYEVFPTHWMPLPSTEAIEKGGV